MKSLRIAWEVGLDVFEFELEDGSTLNHHYMAPQNLVKYLMKEHPVCIFGKENIDNAGQVLTTFWEAYQLYHGSHMTFQHHTGRLDRVIPFAFHGDEGKGKRRSNTTLYSFESVLGLKSDLGECCTCRPHTLTEPGATVPAVEIPNLKSLFTNLKGHSYLQHFPMVVIPGTLAQDYGGLKEALLEHLGNLFDQFFHTGIEINNQKWYGAIVGLKADLKFHSFAARLTRGYEHKGRVCDVECCHHCLAGSAALPAEDLGSNPCWLNTIFVQRPWDPNAPPFFKVPFDTTKPEALYKHDCFHTLRLGVYRDLVASAIFLWLRWGYFGAQGKVPDKLKTAHSHFRLFLTTQQMKASLRSFSPAFFVYKGKKSFPWANAKGSDVTLLMKFVACMAAGYLNTEQDPMRRQVLSTILSTARLGVRIFHHMYDHTLFIDWSCGASLYEKGMSFINGSQ